MYEAGRHPRGRPRGAVTRGPAARFRGCKPPYPIPAGGSSSFCPIDIAAIKQRCGHPTARRRLSRAALEGSGRENRGMRVPARALWTGEQRRARLDGFHPISLGPLLMVVHTGCQDGRCDQCRAIWQLPGPVPQELVSPLRRTCGTRPLGAGPRSSRRSIGAYSHIEIAEALPPSRAAGPRWGRKTQSRSLWLDLQSPILRYRQLPTTPWRTDPVPDREGLVTKDSP